MRITYVTWGTSGDIRPAVALGLGLQQAGHIVQIVTWPDYQELITNLGLGFIPLDPTKWYVEELDGVDFSGQNPFRTARYYHCLLKPFQESFLAELWAVCKNAEVIIFAGAAFACAYIAEKLNIPCFVAPMQPFHQTFAFPHSYVPAHYLGGIYNWLSYLFFDQLFWLSIKEPINQWRKEILNLPPLSYWQGIARWINEKQLPCLYSFSPALLPKPADWSHWVHMTGYWFLQSHQDWQPSKELVEFIASGSPPVYLGFGNKGDWDSDISMRNLLLDALKISGQRGILLVDKDMLNEINLPDEVFAIEWASFDWLFPKMGAVVHHGGCGTVHAAVYAGVPNIIIPYQDDNYFWGDRISKSGLGPKPIKKNQFSAESLANAIKVATTDKTIQSRVAAMSQKIQAENGVQEAVKIFQQYLETQ